MMGDLGGDIFQPWSSVGAQQQEQTAVSKSTNAMKYFHINASLCL